MKWLGRSICALLLCSLIALPRPAPAPARANAIDPWWDDAWPYRIPLTVGGSGVAQAAIDFTAAFAALGLNGGLLDLRSLRVVPYSGATPTSPAPARARRLAAPRSARARRSSTGWSTRQAMPRTR